MRIWKTYPCPDCGLNPVPREVYCTSRGHGCAVVCACGRWGRWARTLRGAVLVWNRDLQKEPR